VTIYIHIELLPNIVILLQNIFIGCLCTCNRIISNYSVCTPYYLNIKHLIFLMTNHKLCLCYATWTVYRIIMSPNRPVCCTGHIERAQSNATINRETMQPYFDKSLSHPSTLTPVALVFPGDFCCECPLTLLSKQMTSMSYWHFCSHICLLLSRYRLS
jgi:hypothetical protein